MCFTRLDSMIWSILEELKSKMMIRDHSIPLGAERIQTQNCQLLRNCKTDCMHQLFQLIKIQGTVILETMISYQIHRAGQMTEKVLKRNLSQFMVLIWKLQDSFNQEIQLNLQFHQDLRWTQQLELKTMLLQEQSNFQIRKERNLILNLNQRNYMRSCFQSKNRMLMIKLKDWLKTVIKRETKDHQAVASTCPRHLSKETPTRTLQDLDLV